MCTPHKAAYTLASFLFTVCKLFDGIIYSEFSCKP